MIRPASCGAQAPVPTKMIGRKGRCPKCSAIVVIEAPAGWSSSDARPSAAIPTSPGPSGGNRFPTASLSSAAIDTAPRAVSTGAGATGATAGPAARAPDPAPGNDAPFRQETLLAAAAMLVLLTGVSWLAVAVAVGFLVPCYVPTVGKSVRLIPAAAALLAMLKWGFISLSMRSASEALQSARLLAASDVIDGLTCLFVVGLAEWVALRPAKTIVGSRKTLMVGAVLGMGVSLFLAPSLVGQALPRVVGLACVGWLSGRLIRGCLRGQPAPAATFRLTAGIAAIAILVVWGLTSAGMNDWSVVWTAVAAARVVTLTTLFAALAPTLLGREKFFVPKREAILLALSLAAVVASPWLWTSRGAGSLDFRWFAIRLALPELVIALGTAASFKRLAPAPGAATPNWRPAFACLVVAGVLLLSSNTLVPMMIANSLSNRR